MRYAHGSDAPSRTCDALAESPDVRIGGCNALREDVLPLSEDVLPLLKFLIPPYQKP